MGEADPVGPLVAALNRLSLAIENQGEPRGQTAAEWEVVEEEPRNQGETLPVSLSERRLRLVAVGDYEGFAELLAPCPDHLVTVCRRLRGGQYSAEYRAKRAWEIGYWAGLAYRGLLRKPRAGLPIDLRPQFYLVLRGRNVTEPTRVSNASDLYRLTGRLDDETLCQGFPSLAEAEVFCAAANIALPAQHQWR